MMFHRILLIVIMLCVSSAFQAGSQQTKTTRQVVQEVKAKAEAGDADSEMWLGAYYDRGVEGLPQDSVEAVKWYRKAAEQNNALAQVALGVCYGNGSGVAKDEAEAVKWYRKAAEQNASEAQLSLGRCYINGHGIVKDEVEAVKWVRKAASQNYAPAQLFLGACYVTGRGVAKDEVEGVNWFRKAAEQNHAPAQYNLGNHYAQGRDISKDEVEGYKWFLLAAAQGDENGKKSITVIESGLTREQMQEGQRRANEFKRSRAIGSRGY